MRCTDDRRKPYWNNLKIIASSVAILSVIGMLLVGTVSASPSYTWPHLTKCSNCWSPGYNLTYTICYDNMGSNPTILWGGKLTDMLPAETTFISASDGGIYDGVTHTVTWDIGTLEKNQGVKCHTLTVRVNSTTDPATIIKNTATLKDKYNFGVTTNSSSEICYTEIPEFATIALPVASILALFFFFNQRRRTRH